MNSPSPPLPPDDPQRALVVARPDQDATLPFVSLAGDTYTILISGGQTAGRYCLIDMFVPPGGGPPPHRHDFEEMFTVLEGEVEVTFRGAQTILKMGETANIPANAPHHFRNVSEQPARMLCFCSPAGVEEFFLSVGVPAKSRKAVPEPLKPAEQEELKLKAANLAAQYRTEFLHP
ncbi:MAG: cupin domain-containing protein [Verrucomicrobiota bacterium]